MESSYFARLDILELQITFFTPVFSVDNSLRLLSPGGKQKVSFLRRKFLFNLERPEPALLFQLGPDFKK